MKKVACLIYPNFSLYEIINLTSTLVLEYGVEVDYLAPRKDIVYSEDGLPCQPTKLFTDINLADYDCVVLPGMSNVAPALKDAQLIQFLSTLKDKEILVAAISSSPILLAKAGLLKDKMFTGGIWQNFFDYFDFLPKENFRPREVLEDGNLITAIGFAHREFARRVLVHLGLTTDASHAFQERTNLPEEALVFELSEADFATIKAEFEHDGFANEQ